MRPIHPSLFPSLDVMLAASDNKSLVGDIKSEMAAAIDSLRKKRGKGGGAERTAAKEASASFYRPSAQMPVPHRCIQELKILRKELKQRELSAIAEVFASCKVVTATCTGCGDKLLRSAPAFDVVVIDEAAQALEAWCWIAMCKAPKVILAGDHLQLPPTVTSDEASRAGGLPSHLLSLTMLIT
jgi:hypothetical protein